MEEELEKKQCPLCNHILYKKHEGMVCKNHRCKLYFKLGRGWVYLTREKEDSKLFFTSKYDFDITAYHNKKKWLELKSKILYEKGKCEICSSDSFLHVHHILSRSSHPELAMDEENLMVVCQDCHKELHKYDKYKFN